MGFLRRHPVLTASLAAIVVASGLLAATATAVWRAAHRDEARRVDHADVVVVLGAAQYQGRPSLVFEARLDHAAIMFQEGFAEKVLVIGGNRPGDVSSEGEAGREYLISTKGLPFDAVFADSVGGTTYESLRAAAAWMKDRGLTSAFLVSDPWHNLRIRRMARDLGIRAFVSATGASAARSQPTRLAGYTRETFAYLWYRLVRR